jgi:uncharacterized membrane protein YsdA (DUF1294 family)
MTHRHLISAIDSVKEFLFGGKATITVESRDSGKWFTYKVVRHKKDPEMFFVSLLQGPNNEDHFGYIGTIFGGRTFRHTAKSRVTPSSLGFIAFNYVFNHLVGAHTSLLEKINVYHSGECGRCGRKLTTPESIINGIGPECSSILGIKRIKSSLNDPKQLKMKL